jgi:asparagine synthetase B (glutamine-hydrolysing)
VVLTGEGADELFAGDERYRYYTMFSRIGPPYWRMLPDRQGARRVKRLGAELEAVVGRGAAQVGPHLCRASPTPFESLYLENFLCAFSRGQQTGLRGR